jgi:hypothetical protein
VNGGWALEDSLWDDISASVDALLTHGADIRRPDGHGRTPLTFILSEAAEQATWDKNASRRRFFCECIEFLLSRGADPLARHGPEGKSCGRLAAEMANPEALKLLETAAAEAGQKLQLDSDWPLSEMLAYISQGGTGYARILLKRKYIKAMAKDLPADFGELLAQIVHRICARPFKAYMLLLKVLMSVDLGEEVWCASVCQDGCGKTFWEHMDGLERRFRKGPCRKLAGWLVGRAEKFGADQYAVVEEVEGGEGPSG